MQVGTCRPTPGVATETDDLAAPVRAGRCSSTEMAVAAGDAGPVQVKGPTMGSTPTTLANTVMGGPHRPAHQAGDIESWMIRFHPLGHNTRHRHQQ